MVEILSGRSGSSLCVVHLFYSNIHFIWFDAVICISNASVGVTNFKSFSSNEHIITCEPVVRGKYHRKAGNYGGFLNE